MDLMDIWINTYMFTILWVGYLMIALELFGSSAWGGSCSFQTFSVNCASGELQPLAPGVSWPSSWWWYPCCAGGVGSFVQPWCFPTTAGEDWSTWRGAWWSWCLLWLELLLGICGCGFRNTIGAVDARTWGDWGGGWDSSCWSRGGICDLELSWVATYHHCPALGSNHCGECWSICLCGSCYYYPLRSRRFWLTPTTSPPPLRRRLFLCGSPKLSELWTCPFWPTWKIGWGPLQDRGCLEPDWLVLFEQEW